MSYLLFFNFVINTIPLIFFSYTFFLKSSATLMKKACLDSQIYLPNLLYLQKLQGT